MKSQKLEQLRRCNSLLKSKSWNVYRDFLRVLLRSNPSPRTARLVDLLDLQDYTGLVEEADSLASTVYPTATEHRLLNQIAAVIRKYPFPESVTSFRPREKALATFLRSEQRCKRVNTRFSLYMKLRSPHERALNSAREWISYTLGSLSKRDVWDNCNFGPGAAIGVHGNATNSARKLLGQNWSVSTCAFHYGYASLAGDFHIRELLLQNTEGSPYSYDPEVLYHRYRKKVTVVDYNKIAFVPKTVKTERTIAVEPMLNGYIQKGVDILMRKRLKRRGIDLSDQSINQVAAREGSLPGNSDPYVTIDLSSASDSISINLCRYLLPDDWFEFLDSIRSKSYSIGGVVKPYHKFVTMGNGFCFPLETLIFASLCAVSYDELRLKPDFKVYGDDIIVRKSCAARVLELLTICGFKANTDKTFLEGPFRESCGADWFEGEDVRPLTLDYAFDSLENIFKFCNLSKSKYTWECVFDECTEFLRSLIPKSLYFTRPYKGNVDTALEVPWDVFLVSPFSRWSIATQSWSWIEIGKSAFCDKAVSRHTGYAVVLNRGALTGSKSSCPFSERRKTRTKIRRISHSGGWQLWLPGETWSREAALPMLDV